MSNVILGTGSYLPERIVTNEDLEAIGVDYDRARAGNLTLDQWVRSRHGAGSRHWASPGERTSDMAAAGPPRALEDRRPDQRDAGAIGLARVSHREPPPDTP